MWGTTPTHQAPMSSDTSPDPVAALLIEAALIISSFRNRNAQSGYQLREPPGTDTILSRIDKLVHADKPEKTEPVKIQRKRAARQKPEKGYEFQPAHRHAESAGEFDIPRLAR